MPTVQLEAYRVAQAEKNLIAIAWMSFFWSSSTLMVFSVLPAFLSDELHVSNRQIGMIEGIAISSAFSAKIMAGFVSDIGIRKPLIVLGTIITAITRVMFTLAGGIPEVFVARFMDRFSKGLRSAPTDVLLADIGTGSTYGRVYGLRQTLYTFGAVVGAIAAMGILYLSNNNFRLVFLCSILPALVGLLVLIFWVHDCYIKQPKIVLSFSWLQQQVLALPRVYWRILAVVGLLMLARFSEAFILLHAKELGWNISFLPMIIIVMDIVHSSIAWPSGKLSDEMPVNRMLLFGLILFVLAHTLLFFANSVFWIVVSVVVVGIHMGVTQGLLRKLIVQSTPRHTRGTAFALFYTVCGIAVLVGNYVCGWIADTYGLRYIFVVGAIITLLTLSVAFVCGLLQSTHKI